MATVDVVILAAGKGERLFSLTRGGSKGLLNIAGLSVLHRSLSFASELLPARIIVTTGHMAKEMQAGVESFQGSCEIEVVNSLRYQDGSLTGLKAAMTQMGPRNFFILNMDHIFPHPFAAECRKTTQQSEISIFCDQQRLLTPDDMKVCADTEGRPMRMGKRLETFTHGYIGITYVPQSQYESYREAVDRLLDSSRAPLNVEAVVDYLMDERKIRLEHVNPGTWYEIDSPDDVRRADYAIAHARGSFDRQVAPA